MSGAFITDDVSAMMDASEFGVSVTGAALPYNAILDRYSADAFGDAGVRGVTHLMQYRGTDDAALKRGDVRSVAGASFQVLDAPEALDDGALHSVRLKKL